jgi:hypothetical protein
MFGGLRLHPCSSLPLTALPFACRSMDKLGERSSCPAVSRSYSSIRARLRDILISSRSSLLPEHAAHAFGPPHLTPTFPQVTFVYTVSRRLVVKHNWQCGGACCAEGARLAAGTRSMGCGKAGRAGWGRMDVFVRRDGVWGCCGSRCWCCFGELTFQLAFALTVESGPRSSVCTRVHRLNSMVACYALCGGPVVRREIVPSVCEATPVSGLCERIGTFTIVELRCIFELCHVPGCFRYVRAPHKRLVSVAGAQ